MIAGVVYTSEDAGVKGCAGDSDTEPEGIKILNRTKLPIMTPRYDNRFKKVDPPDMVSVVSLIF